MLQVTPALPFPMLLAVYDINDSLLYFTIWTTQDKNNCWQIQITIIVRQKISPAWFLLDEARCSVMFMSLQMGG